MLPLMSPQPDESGRNRPAVLFIGLLALLVAGGLAFIMNPALMSRALVPIILGLVLVVLPVVYFTTRSQTEKRKRSGQDMYQMIDRLVHDLDDDEIAYLQRRLEERAATQKARLSEDMVELINLRDLERRAGEREKQG